MDPGWTLIWPQANSLKPSVSDNSPFGASLTTELFGLGAAAQQILTDVYWANFCYCTI